MRFLRLFRRPLAWLAIIPVVVLVVAVVAPYVYINFVQGDPPARLSPSGTQGGAQSGAEAAGGRTFTGDELAGKWTVAEGSTAGYRVKEVLFGQGTEAVGRTTAVTGGVTVEGTTVMAGSFTVDMTTVKSDRDRRDNQFRGRIMDTATYPTATFALTAPVRLDEVPTGAETTTATATGQFSIRGRTHAVTVDIVARATGDRMEVGGTIPVEFADYGIPDASFGPAAVEDHGEIEFLLVLQRS